MRLRNLLVLITLITLMLGGTFTCEVNNNNDHMRHMGMTQPSPM